MFTRRAIILGVFTLFFILLLVFGGISLLGYLNNFWRGKQSAPPTSNPIAPLPPRIAAIPEATNSAQLPLNGFADPNTKVIIFLNAQPVATVSSDPKGQFNLPHLTLQEGNNTIYAITYRQQQHSPPSEIYRVDYDHQPPKLEIKKPGQVTSVSYQRNINLEGITENNVKLTINDHLVLVDNQGHFSYPFELANGDNKIVIKAQDLAGNTSQKTIFITYHP